MKSIGLGCFVAICIACFELQPQWREEIFSRSAYMGMFILCLLWIWFLGKATSKVSKNLILEHRWGLLCIAGLLAVLVQSVPFELRVLADESNLLSVSRSMFDSKETLNSISGKVYYDNYHSTHTVVPIRPPLFPFLVHLNHFLFGYSPQNAGLTNLMLLAGLMGLIYSIIQEYYDKTQGIAALFILVSIPILSLCTRSAGFDLLSVFLILQLFHGLHRYDRNPCDHNLWWVWLCLLLFAHARYENALSIFFVVVYLLIKHERYVMPKTPIMITSAAVLLLPKWFQLRLSAGQYENEDKALLSFSNLFEHVCRFLESLIDFRFLLPYNNILNVVGLISLGLILYECGFNKRSKRILLELSLIALFSAIFFAHFLGDYQNHTSLRFFLLLNITLGLLALHLLTRYLSPRSVLLTGVALFILYHPIAVRNEYLNALLYPREARIIYRYLDAHQSPNTLLLVDMPGAFVVRDVGALSIEYANLNIDSIKDELNRRLYTQLLIAQRIDHQTQAPIEEDAIDDRYQLQTLHEEQSSDSYFLRISKVFLILEEEPLSPIEDIPFEKPIFKTPLIAPLKPNIKTDVLPERLQVE